jgi:poly [ADP-ribose] polymerase
MASTRVKAWKVGEKRAPSFPDDYEILRKAVLQVTEIKSNHNKYYAIELHQGKGKGRFRVFTHYGRTDDLETNPNAGQKECRYFDAREEAEECYEAIYSEKTSKRKGYKEVALASSKIGSEKARGTSSGELDAKTTARLKDGKKGKGKPAPAVKTSKLEPGLQELVKYIYSEATRALTSTVNATITAHGIETPLGILTIGQIEKGEEILDQAYKVFKEGGKGAKKELVELSGEFYTAIPHRIGRSRKSVDIAVLDTLEEFRQKQETLQLMKDMLSVNGEGGSVLYDAKVDEEYRALGCKLELLKPKSSEFREMKDHAEGEGYISVKNVFRVRRDAEWKAFDDHIKNQKLLFHGSGIHNWVGILSRGILLPKIVVSMGGGRTDEGWLGHGIYFGDISATSANYASPGKKGTSFLAIVRVALGKIKQYEEITYGLTKPPRGYDSCHGVSGTEFDDDEFVVYSEKQQRMEYLVEFH